MCSIPTVVPARLGLRLGLGLGLSLGGELLRQSTPGMADRVRARARVRVSKLGGELLHQRQHFLHYILHDYNPSHIIYANTGTNTTCN